MRKLKWAPEAVADLKYWRTTDLKKYRKIMTLCTVLESKSSALYPVLESKSSALDIFEPGLIIAMFPNLKIWTPADTFFCTRKLVLQYLYQNIHASEFITLSETLLKHLKQD